MVINELGWVADGWDDSQSGPGHIHRRAASCDCSQCSECRGQLR